MAKNQKQFRVIWVLENGEKLYSCTRGKPDLWTVKELTELIEEIGLGCYWTPDGVIRITNYLVETPSAPINGDLLPNGGLAVEA
jgi:hypothetical protein